MGRNSFRTPHRHPALDHTTKLPCCVGFQPLISLNALSPAPGLVADSFGSLPIQNRWRCTSGAAGQWVEKKFYPKINRMALLGLDLSYHTSLACALGESAPPLEKIKDKGIKDQRE